MGIAQICLQCGTGLGRIRPRRDPHYGLPLVICPNCHTASVRGKNSASEAWKTVLRRGWVAGLIIEKSLISLALLGFMITAILLLFFGEFEIGRNVTKSGYMITVAVFMIALPLVTGAWLAFAFSHLSRPGVFASWFGLIALIFVLVGSIYGITDLGRGFSRTDVNLPSLTTQALAGLRFLLPSCLGLLAVMMMVSLAGIPLGRTAESARRALARRHWRWLLRRRRLRRSHE